MSVLEMTLILAVFVALLFGLMLLRQRTIAQSIGTVNCQVRSSLGGNFIPGSLHYSATKLKFYRTFSLSPTPSITWVRDGLSIVERGKAADLGRSDVPPWVAGQYLVVCRYNGKPLELLMMPEAYSGFASWLEAAPPASETGIF